MADRPGFPDCNTAMSVDGRGRLWLCWPTIIGSSWESALLNYRVATDYSEPGPPKWDREGVILLGRFASQPGCLDLGRRRAYLEMDQAPRATRGGPLSLPRRYSRTRRHYPRGLQLLDRPGDDPHRNAGKQVRCAYAQGDQARHVQRGLGSRGRLMRRIAFSCIASVRACHRHGLPEGAGSAMPVGQGSTTNRTNRTSQDGTGSDRAVIKCG
jgi:hypothetical protein